MCAPTGERELRARLTSEGLHPSAWGNDAFDRYGAHRHAFDKVLVAAAGSITFHLPELGRDVLLASGDRLHLPAGTMHAADVGPHGVTCLEAHLPAGILAPAPEHLPGWAVSGGQTEAAEEAERAVE
jgi:uncharacterized protein YjlB